MVERLRSRALVSAKTQKLEDYTIKYSFNDQAFEYDMVAIKGGSFAMGSPETEKHRLKDEGPVREVKISPFWMGKFELTWELYEPFMITKTPRRKDGAPIKILPDSPDHYVVSKPTSPYTEMDFGMGTEKGYPAISMTQHAASKYCQWLSAKTGHFYRLPTEAEWEYACRAGTTGPFSCPAGQIGDHAVFEPDVTYPVRANYEKVGTKKPNPWGLHDMHGNLMEWCLDQYNSLSYQSDRSIEVDPFVRGHRLYPRVARGGSWYDPLEDCRSARRWASDPNWKAQDAQLPASAWYHTDALWLGFRIIRPFKIPTTEEMDFYWNSAHPKLFERQR